MPKSNSSPLLPALLAGASMIVPVAPVLAAPDFQLPPSTTTRPRAQGPVDAGEAPPRTAAPAPTPTPAAAPTPAPVPVVTVPVPATSAPAPRPTAKPGPTAKPSQPAQAPAAAPSSAPTVVATPAPLPAATPSAPPSLTPPVASATPAPQAAAPAPNPAVLPAWWPWAAGGAALLAILGGLAALFVRRLSERADEAPELERPVVLERPKVPARAVPAPTPAPVPEPEPDHGPLSMALEARALTISFGAATLAYRITLTNTGETALGGVEISGDMVSAHASLALEDQLASPEAPLAPAHEIERIRPGESVQVNGEFRLPLQAVRPIVQGNAQLLVPLARLRIHAAQGGNGALIKTALVGQRATRPGAGLQPFRLDFGPRIYREVTQKIF